MPEHPELRIDTSGMQPMEAVQEIYLYLLKGAARNSAACSGAQRFVVGARSIPEKSSECFRQVQQVGRILSLTRIRGPDG